MNDSSLRAYLRYCLRYAIYFKKYMFGGKLQDSIEEKNCWIYTFAPLGRDSRTSIASIIMGIILFIFYVVCPISTPKEEAIRRDIFMVIAGINHKSLIVHSLAAFISFVMILATRQSPARLAFPFLQLGALVIFLATFSSHTTIKRSSSGNETFCTI